jgi:ferric-dicitrate binding protein FerR (iron transport regulator)
VREWNQDAIGTHFEPYGYSEFIATRAAQWGADQELEACVDWLSNARNHTLTWNEATNYSANLRAARRPKPPSLKEQALEALREAESSGCLYVNGRSDTIRRALEQLDD